MHSALRIGVLAAFAGLLWGQAGPAFDAASIKPAQSGVRGYSIQALPGRVSAKNATLQQLIAAAYHVHDYQVSGGPKWIQTDRFDVEAKAPDAVTPPGEKELMAMLRKLLDERFELKVTRETRELPVYLLQTGKGGPKVRHSQDTSVPVYFRVVQRHQVTSQNAPLSDLVETLSWILGRPVVDQTEISGPLDYKLEWAPDDLQLRSDESPVQNEGGLPSLGSALQEVLGLRLVSQKGPVEMVRVDRAEKPGVN